MSRTQSDRPDEALDSRSALVLERARQVVTERQVEGALREAMRQRPWRWVSGLFALAWMLGVLWWPAGTVVDRLRLLVRGVCDQLNNIPSSGVALPLDARCTGIYSGMLVAMLYLAGRRRLSSVQFPARVLGVVLASALVVMGTDGVNSLVSQYGYAFYPPRTSVRLGTGLAAGIATAMLGIPVFNAGLRAPAPRVQRRAASWGDVLAIGGITVSIGVAAWQDWAWLFYPLAIFSVAGLISGLFVINLATSALLSGMRRRVRVAGQLARPAAFSIALTAIELALLGHLRDLGEPIVHVLALFH